MDNILTERQTTCDANGSPARTTVSVVLRGTRIQERIRSEALNLQGMEFARKGGVNCKERNVQGKAPQFASV